MYDYFTLDVNWQHIHYGMNYCYSIHTNTVVAFIFVGVNFRGLTETNWDVLWHLNSWFWYMQMTPLVIYTWWIFNYLCNQCLSPLTLYSIQHYVIKFVRELRQVCGFPRSTPLIKLTAMIYLKYCWKWC